MLLIVVLEGSSYSENKGSAQLCLSKLTAYEQFDFFLTRHLILGIWENVGIVSVHDYYIGTCCTKSPSAQA